MARSLNKVTLIGNVGTDPDIRSTSGGGKAANFSVATSNVWTDANGQRQEKTEWHRCVAWNAGKYTLADIVERYVKKGDKLYLEGELATREWTDKEGVKRYTTEIKVRELLLLGGKPADEPSPAPSRQAPRPERPGSDRSAALDDDDDGLPF
jgi:single-strand DNA-binding protein